MNGFSRFIPLSALTLLLATSPSWAQENPRAEVLPLYDEAQRAMAAKDYASACPKFADITLRYPEGVGAWLEYGRCEQERGRLATAYDIFRRAEAKAAEYGQTERIKRGADAAKALQPRLSLWTIAVPESVKILRGVVVLADGKPLASSSWDKPFPVDGGHHVVVVEAPGKKSWSKELDIAPERDSVTVRVNLLADADNPSSAPSARIVEAPDDPGNVRRARQNPLQTAGFIGGGVGVAALVGGAIAGGFAFSKHGEAVEGSPPPCVQNECNRLGDDLEKQSRRAGNVSTGLVIAGGVLVASGVVLVFALPGKAERGTPKVGVGPGGIIVSGAF